MGTEFPYHVISTSRDDLVISPDVQDWCLKPYKQNKNGCPMYGTRKSCLDEVIDLDKECVIITTDYDLESRREEMTQHHPDWTEEQLNCVYYWQSLADKQMDEVVKEVKRNFGMQNPVMIRRPEAHGVNLCRTLGKFKEYLMWDYPLDTVKRVVILGYPVRSALHEIFG